MNKYTILSRESVTVHKTYFTKVLTEHKLHKRSLSTQGRLAIRMKVRLGRGTANGLGELRPLASILAELFT